MHFIISSFPGRALITIKRWAALAEETEPVCVCDLTGALALKQPTVSHHLKLLKDAGVVDSEKRGVWSHWLVKRDGVAQLRRRVTASLEALE